MNVYADNAATTAVSATALAAMMPCFQEIYGNPSSLHTPGQRAAEKLAAARETFAKYLNGDPREITFTSGGSEADNQALRSAALLGARKGKKHIISTKFEHHAILHSLQLYGCRPAAVASGTLIYILSAKPSMPLPGTTGTSLLHLLRNCLSP